MSAAADGDIVRILEAALEAARHLASLWRHEAQPLIEADDYSPEQVHWILRSWESLRTGAEGGTGGSYDGSGGGTHDRLELAAMLADVALATDRALADRLHWSSARRVYERQGRPMPIWGRAADAPVEPVYPHGHWRCCELIAEQLGWPGYLLAA